MEPTPPTVRARDLGIRIGAAGAGAHATPSPMWRACAWGTRRSSRARARWSSARGPVRTGVTVVVPRGEPFVESFYAGCHRLNGNGELTGLEWIRENGMLTTPVAITNTHSVGVVRDALITAAVRRDAAHPVVVPAGGGRDLGRAPQRHRRPARPARAPVRGARGRARRARSSEGNVGGGTGMICHEFKGGIGTASRVLARRRRRLDGGRPGPGEPRPSRAAVHRRHARRSRHPDRGRARAPGTTPPPADGRRLAAAGLRLASSSSWRPTRRSCRTSASGSRSGRAWASRGSAGRGRTAAATCSCASRPAIAACRPRTTRRVRPRTRERHRARRPVDQPAVLGGHRGDRGGHRQRARRGPHHDRSRRHHGARAAPRQAATDRGNVGRHGSWTSNGPRRVAAGPPPCR